MKKSLKTLISTLGALGMAAIGTAASAAPANSTVALNIRTGPGIGFAVVDTLLPGELVEVTECIAGGGGGGWCRIEHPGPDGWVSSRFLVASSPGGAPDPNCSFGLSLGPGGPKFSINCGGQPGQPVPPAPPPPVPMPIANTACMYTGINFSGAELCLEPTLLNTLGGTFNDRISSVRLFGNAKVKLCRNYNLSGLCRDIVNSRANLGGAINNKASSLAVYTGAGPVAPLIPPAVFPGPPVTFSTGGINLKQTFTADLDNGTTGGGGADIWYQAVNAVEKYVTPRNGARISLTNGAQRGYAGCSVAGYSANQVPLAKFPAGTYVCVKTNQGRISEFRVNGYAGTTMKIGFTTWAN